MAALWHKTYAEWMGSLHGAEVSEVFDTQMDVEQDPCGAHWAIHHMDAEIARLTAELTSLRAGQDALDALLRAERVKALREAADRTLGLATGHECRAAILAMIETEANNDR